MTGATGGVGSIATLLLATAGFDVDASTGRIDRFGDYLSDLGATTLVPRAELEGGAARCRRRATRPWSTRSAARYWPTPSPAPSPAAPSRPAASRVRTTCRPR
ncbi:hypothetical protein [Tessaracoccus coleopterorum]|uniref:hypothetical protein n=1 Tax=Tessaracoccus coleopterorum TaxID=2714950 RepID=UPI0018D33087|nr:hypothetical protein [Tessaracoccus coleopterorum]